MKESEYERLKRLEVENIALKDFLIYIKHSKTGNPIDIEINFDEIIRLKRLDDNIKREINRKKQIQNDYIKQGWESDVTIIGKEIELLESLDK